MKQPFKIREKTYNVWYTMLWRCRQTTGHPYKYYGSRGIRVCKRWQDFNSFLEDMGLKPEGMSLDRIDNNGNYEPSNCRWATTKEQGNNRRGNRLITVNGETKTLTEWARTLESNKTSVWAVRWWAKKGDDYFRKRVSALRC